MKNRKTFRISPPLNKVDKPPKLLPSLGRRSSSLGQSVVRRQNMSYRLLQPKFNRYVTHFFMGRKVNQERK